MKTAPIDIHLILEDHIYPHRQKMLCGTNMAVAPVVDGMTSINDYEGYYGRSTEKLQPRERFCPCCVAAFDA